MNQIGHIVIGLIAVAAAVYLIVFISQRVTANRVAKLLVRRQELKDLPMRDRLVAGRKMSLTGQSLQQFQALEAKYSKLEMSGFDDIQEQAEQVLFLSQGVNLVKANIEFRKLRALINDARKNIDIVQQGLNDLEQLDKDHKKAVTELEAKYKELRKTLLSQSFNFGPALEKLEEVLGQLEEEFAEFARLTEEGDHVSAAEIYETLAMETNQLENRIERIPSLFNELNEKIPAQVSEIQTAYNAMTAQGFRFKDDFVEPALEDVDKQRLIGMDLLKAVTLKKVDDKINGLSITIESLYTTLEHEAEAQKTVDNQLGELVEYWRHNNRQNHDLMIEVDRLNQDFVFTKNELEQVRTWSMELHQIDQHLSGVQRNIDAHEVVYSTLGASLDADNQKLEHLEQDQIHLWNALQQLPKIVKQSQDRVELFVEKLRNLSRRVERRNLPGVPQSYLDFFHSVNDELGRLKEQLEAARINVDDVQRQLSIVSADLDNFETQTNELLEGAALTERLSRKAFLYKETPEVKRAVNEAQYYYNQSFDYQAAVNLLGAAIDKVEPGATERIRNQYRADEVKLNS
ncbi:MAG: septation ring formation regulator EzrA [Lactobacillaceae bacterium]|jgi:septation ring formation regulator|nr:septation ring formation regulator EzrA [Lactobacillaceae bacterium]